MRALKASYLKRKKKRDIAQRRRFERDQNEAARASQSEKMIAAIATLISKIAENRDQRASNEKRKNVREWVSAVGVLITAIFAAFAAGVAIWAVLQASDDSNKQTTVMQAQLSAIQGQLQEMRSTGFQTDQLIETNQKLADAAVRSANIAEKTLMITQRAYFTVVPSLTGYGKDNRPKASLAIKNVGSTPGYSVTLRTFLGILEFPFPDNVRLPSEVASTVSSAVVKDEGLIGSVEMKVPLDPYFDEVDKGGRLRIGVWGIIEYTDAFSCRIRRNVCFFFSGEEVKTGKPLVCPGNRNNEEYIGNCAKP